MAVMKRTLLLPFLAAAGSLLSCGEPVRDVAGQENVEALFELKDANDSLSYSVGVVFSSEMYSVMQERGYAFGLEKEFVKGLRGAFAVEETPQAYAYANGVRLAAGVAEDLEYEKKFWGVDAAKINRTDCLRALTEMANGKYGPEEILSAKRCAEKGIAAGLSDFSYAVGVLLFMEYSYLADNVGDREAGGFVRGVKDGFPLGNSREASAFVAGVMAAMQAGDLLDSNREFLMSDGGAPLDRRAYLEAVVASASGRNGEKELLEASERFNVAFFCRPAERFMENNRKRHGVCELPDGLQYRITVHGDGPVAKQDDVVKCVYKCTLTDGRIISTSRGKAAALKVGEQLPGLQEALVTLPAGTECMLYLPWQLAYGAEGGEGVPPYSVVVYDLAIVGAE